MVPDIDSASSCLSFGKKEKVTMVTSESVTMHKCIFGFDLFIGSVINRSNTPIDYKYLNVKKL